MLGSAAGHYSALQFNELLLKPHHSYELKLFDSVISCSVLHPLLHYVLSAALTLSPKLHILSVIQTKEKLEVPITLAGQDDVAFFSPGW